MSNIKSEYMEAKQERREKKRMNKRKIDAEDVIYIFEKVLAGWPTIRIYNTVILKYKQHPPSSFSHPLFPSSSPSYYGPSKSPTLSPSSYYGPSQPLSSASTPTITTFITNNTTNNNTTTMQTNNYKHKHRHIPPPHITKKIVEQIATGNCKVFEKELSPERFQYYCQLREKVYKYNKNEKIVDSQIEPTIS